MSRYFFHTEGMDLNVDEEGTELPTFEAARAEAMRTAGQIMREAGLFGRSDDFRSDKVWRLWVTDEAGGSGETYLTIHVLVQDGPPSMLPHKPEQRTTLAVLGP
jgi:hypothetical protein